MLVLSRKKEEKIQVGQDITITILRIKGRSVQIGIEAPTGVTILRSELAPNLAEQARRRVPRQPFPSLQSPHHGVGPASLHTEVASLCDSQLRATAS